MRRAIHAVVLAFFGGCFGCGSTHFNRGEVHTPSTDAVKQCSSDRYHDTECFEVVETDREDVAYGVGTGYYGAGIGMYPQGLMAPAIQAVSYEPMVVVPEGERAMEGIPGGQVRYDPVAVIPPAGEYATKEQLKDVARQVRDLKRQAKGGETKSEKEGK